MQTSNKKWLYNFLILFISLFIEQNILAQNVTPQINIGESFIIHSSILNEDRTILLYKPEGYAESNELYPVLYLTDGESHLFHTGGIVNFLSSTGIGYMPKLLIVGITNTDRARDLTPPTLHGIDTQFPNGGGAESFYHL